VRWFFGLIHPIYNVDRKNLKKFKLRIIIKQGKHTFKSFGVLGDYVKSLFASSLCTHRFFPRILGMCLNTFCVFGDDFVYRK
jgi:hypothetical protein